MNNPICPIIEKSNDFENNSNNNAINRINNKNQNEIIFQDKYLVQQIEDKIMNNKNNINNLQYSCSNSFNIIKKETNDFFRKN